MGRKGFSLPLVILFAIVLLSVGLILLLVLLKPNPESKRKADSINGDNSAHLDSTNKVQPLSTPRVFINFVSCKDIIDIQPRDVVGIENWQVINGCQISEGFDPKGENFYPDSPYAFKIPPGWVFGGTINNEKGEKIGESIFYHSKKEEDCKKLLDEISYEKHISVENITIGNLKGIKVIRAQVTPEYGVPWYPNFYCLEKGNNVISAQFYKKNLNEGSHVIFEKILATVNFPSDDNWYPK